MKTIKSCAYKSTNTGMLFESWECRVTQSPLWDALLMQQRCGRVNNKVRSLLNSIRCTMYLLITLNHCLYGPQTSPPFPWKSITCMLTDWRRERLVLNHAPPKLNNQQANSQAWYILQTAEPEACKASGTQSPDLTRDSGTTGRATYQGTSLVVTIPCAWRVFGPFCHFAL